MLVLCVYSKPNNPYAGVMIECNHSSEILFKFEQKIQHKIKKYKEAIDVSNAWGDTEHKRTLEHEVMFHQGCRLISYLPQNGKMEF